jgi:hypothetical protein
MRMGNTAKGLKNRLDDRFTSRTFVGGDSSEDAI